MVMVEKEEQGGGGDISHVLYFLCVCVWSKDVCDSWKSPNCF